jgi:hypothetical protein
MSDDKFKANKFLTDIGLGFFVQEVPKAVDPIPDNVSHEFLKRLSEKCYPVVCDMAVPEYAVEVQLNNLIETYDIQMVEQCLLFLKMKKGA